MKRKGLTLIEILVAAVLIGISLAALSTALVTGKHFIKKAENDGKALNLALSRKEELLSYSYGRNELCQGAAGTQCSDSETLVDGLFNWTTTVVNKEVCGDVVAARCIPYKEITAEVEYPEEMISGVSTGVMKRVTVRDIVPFPKVHLLSADTGVSECTVTACEVSLAWKVVGDGGTNSLEIQLPAYPVDKDLLILYDIAINIEDAGTPPDDIKGNELILTRVTLNNVPYDPPTGTPIMSQALIENALEIDGVQGNPNGGNIVRVMWSKPVNHGVISIRRASLIVIAFEID